jgi:DNA polymerase-1
MIGFDPAKTLELHKRLFSLPPVGIGLKPSSFTPGGAPQVDEVFLERIGHPLTALVLEYRRLQKAKSTYFDAYIRMGSSDGLIHTTFKQHGTVTGRLSGEAPNLQNIPREGGKSQAASLIKKCFRPSNKSELWEFDFRTIEYRLAAVYSKESSLIEIFREEGDIHQTVADMLHIPRQVAKTTNYLILYGGQAGKLAWQLGTSKSRAEGILSQMRQTYPGLFGVMDRAESQAHSQGYIKMWTGRKRHFRYREEERKAFNAAIQGGAFEIVKRAGLNASTAGYKPVNQVHDSWWFDIPKEDVKDALVEIPRALSDWTEEAFGLKFTVDAKRLAS